MGGEGRARPRVWEVLDEYESRYRVARWSALVLLLATAVLSAALYRLAVEPRPVIVVPGADAVGVFRPGEVPPEVARTFAETFVHHLCNFTPATVEARQAAIRRFMGPELLSDFDGQSEVVARRTRINQESQVLMPEGSRVEVLEANRRWRVTVLGRREVYVGSSRIRSTPWEVGVELERVPATDDNPYGLQVVSVRQRPRGEGGRPR